MKTNYILLKEIKYKKRILNIFVDKLSDFYLSESNDIKNLDNDFFLKNLSDLKSAKFEGIKNEYYKAITKEQKEKIIRNDNTWINKQNSNIKNASIFTMLKNKGY